MLDVIFVLPADYTLNNIHRNEVRHHNGQQLYFGKEWIIQQ